jgi:hypothetical protein
MDMPIHIDQSAHGSLPAIPGNVLSHIRHATGMPLNCHRTYPVASGLILSSKIRALLDDLPREERSVVFASSKATIQHVISVLNLTGLGCRGLFTGQSETDSERAVSEWKADPSVFVLVVQAGAAACGLTLTAASKMFLLEPFLKHEEEKQAYARLHRYGQRDEVVCKVYYTPVSVESRLLEWRRRADTHASPAEETKTVYAPLRNDVACEEEEEDENENLHDNQTRFLLGLDNEAGSGMAA